MSVPSITSLPKLSTGAYYAVLNLPLVSALCVLIHHLLELFLLFFKYFQVRVSLLLQNFIHLCYPIMVALIHGLARLGKLCKHLLPHLHGTDSSCVF